jgi:hypothetical protein
MAEKLMTLAEKRALAEKLGTGGAAKAGKALANRQAKIDAAMEDSRGPKDDSFDEAVKKVQSATKKKGGALTKSNYW